MDVDVETFAITNTGLLRPENEDSFLLYHPADEGLRRSKGILAVVADGVGGHLGGRKASETTVTLIKEHYVKGSADVQSSLTQAFGIANAGIYALANKNMQYRGMATTCTAMVLKEKEGVIAHVGDSRAYIFRQGDLTQITTDHTLVERFVSEGHITRRQAKNHPQRNVLLRALGSKGTVEIETHHVILGDGDTILLCSDGLHGMVSHEEITSILSSSCPLAEGGNRMIDLANKAGGADNITLILLRIRTTEIDKTPIPTETKAAYA